MWWGLDATEPRRILQGKADEWKPETSSFGLPGYCRSGTVIAESEAAYLERLNLLSTQERATLGPDFDREEVLWTPHNPLSTKRALRRLQLAHARFAGDMERAEALEAEIEAINQSLAQPGGDRA